MNFKSDGEMQQFIRRVLSGEVPIVVVDGAQLLSRRRAPMKFCVSVSTADSSSRHYFSDARDAVKFYEASLDEGGRCDIYQR